MFNMRRFTCLFLLLFVVAHAPAGEFADVIDDVSMHFQTGDTRELSKFFSTSMSISLRKDEGVYSKVQSEIILKEFFNRNTPESIEFVHRLDSNPNFRYVVLHLKTSNGTFRVSYKLVSEGNKFKMTELRIE